MGKKHTTYLDGFPYSWGHRGFSSEAPENTIEAFTLCVERNVLGVELDVQLCKTGEVIVFHDTNLERITGYNGNVKDTPYSTIKSLNGAQNSTTYTHCTIPTLDQVFTQVPSLFIDIELKGPTKDGAELVKKVLDMITKHNMKNRVVVSSFNPFLIRKFQKLTKSIPTAVIWSKDTSNKLISWGITKQLVSHNFTKPHVDIAYTQGGIKKEILTWTENDPAKQKRLIQRGIRVISDAPIGEI